MTTATQVKTNDSGIRSKAEKGIGKWFGSSQAVKYDQDGIRAIFEKADTPAYIVRAEDGRIGVADSIGTDNKSDLVTAELLTTLPAYLPEQLGDSSFRETYGLKYNYMTGAMANGIGSAELVIAGSKAGILSSFGAAGMVLHRIEEGIKKIQAAVGDGAYAVNLIHSPAEEALERNAAELFMKMGVTIVETSAFMDLTSHIVRYRASGLSKSADGSVVIKNRVISKLSRLEVAEKFLRPAPDSILNDLASKNLITSEQAELARLVPMADDITVEADSGGHTDRRSLVCLLPSIIALRNSIQDELKYKQEVRVGAGGGIGTPDSLLAAFAMGAAYAVTGSINQVTRESGSSDHVRKVLAEADSADVMMAPAADMFELGVKLQVLKKGSLFGLRAQKLYDAYVDYESLEDIPAKEMEGLEKTIFKDTLENIWASCITFFEERDPEQIARAKDNPKRKMALVFRWYLGLSSVWANSGEKGREMDYQIWCGPAMGAFNGWVKGSRLENWENRHVADVAKELLKGGAYLFRLQYLEMYGIHLHPRYREVKVK
ncbi:MAG TPA: PfaD family polyunsaturated fatty acid/polyketide biosynthesis protein [Flavobacteriales bacterium]|nr:PfaD family polyunsaturated fatty acid/polyketide biosynthesis protein [Flavobacteriales bacterium]HIO67833.1 PfaD family polyunsaturated fatty acid/polyketide biosynthesis protein [Flavobacteriales bacterium]